MFRPSCVDGLFGLRERKCVFARLLYIYIYILIIIYYNNNNCRSPTEADAQSLRTAVLLDELDFPGFGVPDFRTGASKFLSLNGFEWSLNHVPVRM